MKVRLTYARILECIGDRLMTREEIAKEIHDKYGMTTNSVKCALSFMVRKNLLLIVSRSKEKVITLKRGVDTW